MKPLSSNLSGLFISFEGGEGSGKSSQVAGLKKHLEAQGQDIVVTREPGGTPIGTEIRKILLAEKSQITPMAELLLYAADRAQHVETVLGPALAKGQMVISDRYSDSTWVYQGLARGLDRQFLEVLNENATGGLKPDLTFLLDVPEEIGLARSKNRLQAQNSEEGRFEKEALEFHQKVRQGFLELAAREPQRFVVLDATQSQEQLAIQIQKRVQELINQIEE